MPEKNSSATKAIGKENVEWVSLRVSILYELRKNEEHKSKRENGGRLGGPRESRGSRRLGIEAKKKGQ